ncbi:purine-cytosine permease family protein [Paraburkholderia saeva]|uniref:Allantoin permease n=1 Tax=Paraburkholderia saeva TaxID=2777537 RepID=A0A9N8WZQ9_9BURK|nr:hypothetical protein [Paraburkholderia saeva]CAG4886897.1 hypothetical protein R70241_00283 [Paraburkholderia saeva]CAG4887092.1 hypothetical protein LMG31841_00335 [Paraburkholderia saeva]
MHVHKQQAPALRVSATEDPVAAAKQRQADYVNHAVPLTARVGRWQLTMSYWSLLSAMCWVFFGALAATLYGTVPALIALAVTIACMSLLGPMFTRNSVLGGLSSTLLSRRPFGLLGGTLTSLLMAAMVTYYTIFESSTLAVSLKLYFGGGLPMWFWYALVSLAMLPLMLGSVQSWMAKLNGFLLPFYVVGLAAVVGMAVFHTDQGSAWLHFSGVVPQVARPIPGWLMGFCLLMGTWPLILTGTDFARFGKVEDSGFHEHTTFGFLFYLWLYGANGLAGIYLVRTMLPHDPTQEAGVVQAILSSGGLLGLLLIIVTQTRISTLNYYEASMNFERLAAGTLGIKLGRMAWVLIVGVLTFVLMLTDVFSYLMRALQWQSAFFLGWIAIVATHLWLNPHERKDGLEFRANRVALVTPGLIAWIISGAVGIALTESRSVPALANALASPISLVVGVGLYLLLWKLMPVRARGHALDPRREVSDPRHAWIECASCNNGYTAYETDRDPQQGSAICDECATLTCMGVRSASPLSAATAD